MSTGLGPFPISSYGTPDRDTEVSLPGPDPLHEAGQGVAEVSGDYEQRPFRDRGPISADDTGYEELVGFRFPYRHDGV